MAPLNIELDSGLNAAGTVEDHELFFARRALRLLKRRLGPQRMQDLFAADTVQADEYWERMVRESHEKFREFSITVKAAGISAQDFLKLFKAHMDDLPFMLAAHPEHYINGHTVLETFGEMVSLFDLKFSDSPNDVMKIREAEKYPQGLCASAMLSSGTVIGHICHQFRDVPSEAGDGLEACFGIAIPASVSETVVETHKRHLAVEWSNWIRAAHEEVLLARE